MSISSRNLEATFSRASSGHSVNQSMAQQLMRLGNILSLFLKLDPTGDMASTMCRLVFTFVMKMLYRLANDVSPSSRPSSLSIFYHD